MPTAFNDNLNYWISGREVNMTELLDARERRWHLHQELISRYRQNLICLTLNIPGPVKDFPLSRLAFDAGMLAIKRELSSPPCGISYSESSRETWGCCGIFIIDQNAAACKRRMVHIEETHPLGRIFDIDVLNTRAQKISRTDVGLPRRSCLLCSRPAFDCGRSRRHSVKELLAHQISLMKSYFAQQLAERIAGLFTKAMTYEVTTTPKPGLVDRWHNGSHKDMNIGTFMDSIAALFPYYKECGLKGILFTDSDYPSLFASLRPLGLEAEQVMYRATGNVNTHKGLIFSGGVLCAAAAHCYVQNRNFSHTALSSICRKMLQNLSEDFQARPGGMPQTQGEKLYRAYRLQGIRGEAMRGYPTVFQHGWKVFSACRSHGLPIYKSGRITLLHLIAYSEDTNIIARSSYETWRELTRKLQNCLQVSPAGQLAEESIIARLDAYFMAENISPGGSADLLALVYFLYFLSLI